MLTHLTEKGVDIEDVIDNVNPIAMTEYKDSATFKHDVANHKYQWLDFSPMQKEYFDALPEEFKAIPECNGHMASHQLLIHDFCSACQTRKQPYVNAWRAARYTIPGLIAHQSALAGGVLVDVPDFGECEE